MSGLAAFGVVILISGGILVLIYWAIFSGRGPEVEVPSGAMPLTVRRVRISPKGRVPLLTGGTPFSAVHLARDQIFVSAGVVGRYVFPIAGYEPADGEWITFVNAEGDRLQLVPFTEADRELLQARIAQASETNAERVSVPEGRGGSPRAKR